MKEIRVLVVDDDQSVNRTYSRALEIAGYTVFSATRADEALRIAKDHKPALALVDVQLPPGPDGFELCRTLRNGVRLDTEVFLYTGKYVSSDDRFRACQEGAVNFLMKPISTRELVEEAQFFLSRPKPFTDPPQAKIAAGLPAQMRSSFCDILVVDDDERMIRAISDHLEMGGFAPYGADRGSRAIMMAHRLKPAAVILDINLPDINGVEVMRCLKAHERTKNIPVVIWTASEKQGLELTCLKDGASDYLIKGVHDMGTIPLILKKRLGIMEPAARIVRAGIVAVNLSSQAVTVEGRPIPDLAPREFALLAYLVERSGQVIPWGQLQRDVWKTTPDFMTLTHAPHTMEEIYRRLRENLGPKASACIVVWKGKGLQFDPAKTQQVNV